MEGLQEDLAARREGAMSAAWEDPLNDTRRFGDP